MALDKAALPKNTLLVLRADGRIYSTDFSERPQLDDPGAVDWTIGVSKIIVGKIEQVRTRLISLEEIEFENVITTEQPPPGTANDFEVTLFASQNGKDISATLAPTIVEKTDEYLKLACRHTAKNFSLQLRGTYNINTIVATVHNNGRR